MNRPLLTENQKFERLEFALKYANKDNFDDWVYADET
jgi:hypothetical protein